MDIKTYTDIEVDVIATISEIRLTDLTSLTGEMKITFQQFLDNLLGELNTVNADMIMKKESCQNSYYRSNCDSDTTSE